MTCATRGSRKGSRLPAQIFIIQNAHAVNISFFGAHLHLSLAVALLLAAIAGALPMAAGGDRQDHPATADHAP